MTSTSPNVDVEGRFTVTLQKALQARYGKPPSVAYVTHQFNRHLHQDRGVSQETVRRWMRGLSMPRHEHMAVLVFWLGIDFYKDFRQKQESKSIGNASPHEVARRKVSSLMNHVEGLPPVQQTDLIRELITQLLLTMGRLPS